MHAFEKKLFLAQIDEIRIHLFFALVLELDGGGPEVADFKFDKSHSKSFALSAIMSQSLNYKMFLTFLDILFLLAIYI